MAKSRLTALLLLPLLGLPAAASAAPERSADEAMERYRRSFAQDIPTLECPRGEDGEVVVCGRRASAPDPNRLPLPIEAIPGQRTKGEPLTAVEIAGKRETCSTVGPNQNCGGGLPVLAIGIFIAKTVIDTVVKEVSSED